MSNLNAEVSLLWAGEERIFALKGAQIENLENDLNEGIGNICYRVFSRVDYKFKHLHRTIYWGLIGGGTRPNDAAELVKQYALTGQPIDAKDDPASTLKTASAILKAVHFGWEALPVPSGEAQAGVTRPNEQTSASTAPLSSAPELTPVP